MLKYNEIDLMYAIIWREQIFLKKIMFITVFEFWIIIKADKNYAKEEKKIQIKKKS